MFPETRRRYVPVGLEKSSLIFTVSGNITRFSTDLPCKAFFRLWERRPVTNGACKALIEARKNQPPNYQLRCGIPFAKGLSSRDAAPEPYRDVFTGVPSKGCTAPQPCARIIRDGSSLLNEFYWIALALDHSRCGHRSYRYAPN